MSAVLLSKLLQYLTLGLRVDLKVNFLLSINHLTCIKAQLKFGVVVAGLGWSDAFAWSLFGEDFPEQVFFKHGLAEGLERPGHGADAFRNERKDSSDCRLPLANDPRRLW